MSYKVILDPGAVRDADKLERNEPKAFKKFLSLLDELASHPRTGTGHPEPLSGDRSGQWSRRITKKHRLVYEIMEREVYVYVLAAYGHYEEE